LQVVAISSYKNNVSALKFTRNCLPVKDIKQVYSLALIFFQYSVDDLPILKEYIDTKTDDRSGANRYTGGTK